MRILYSALALLAVAGNVARAQVGCDGVRNVQPVLDLEPKLLKTVENG